MPIRFKTWYITITDDKNVLHHYTMKYKNYELEVIKFKGSKMWDFILKKDGIVTDTFHAHEKRKGIQKAKRMIEEVKE